MLPEIIYFHIRRVKNGERSVALVKGKGSNWREV
ncbi:hypothetical protein J5U23_00427 [Saccharolobus shibatae B12]|uniref:Uncharacterized protein n=1 Tax=Saccharolobus shibatae (strain ATCC 51178 / DSM 5389 / JCM 8931 / NBRC 15437 / B12) TaxID=523848 RepID=A0A8F5BLL3_SACSH|nr:hypothetical protein J5U23_00427 [Saccharolobus shibatae B12]